MANPTVSVLYEIIDKASPQAKKLTDNLSKLGDSMKTVGTGAGGGAGLLGKLSLLTAGFAAAAIGVAALGSALVGVAVSAARNADALQDAADRAGLTVTQYQLLDEAAKLAGSSADEISASANRLGQALAKQDGETGKAARALDVLGISTKNANGEQKSLLQLQTEIVRAAENAPNAARAQGAAIQLLGGEYTKLRTAILRTDEEQKVLFERMSGTGQLVTQQLADDSGTLFDEIDRLKGAFVGMGNSIALVVLPYLNDIVGAIADISEAAARLVRKYSGGGSEAQKAQDRVAELVNRQGELEQQLKPLGLTSGRLIDVFRRMSPSEVQKIKDEIEMTKEMIRVAKLGAAALTDRERQTVTTGGRTAPEAEGETPEERQKRLDKEAREAKQRRDEDLKEYLRVAALKEDDRKRIQEEQNEINEYLDDERKKAEKVTEEYQKKADAVRDGLDPFRELQRIIQEINDNPLLTVEEKLLAAGAATDKWAEGLNRTKAEVGELDEFIKAAAQSMQGAMSDFFFDFMQGNITDLVGSFKRAIDRMVADMLAAKAAVALFGDFGKTGSIGGLAGAAGNFLSGIFRADGGPVTAGQPYIVGERRAEVFVPNVSGKILPDTDSLAGMQSAMSVTFNIQAMDAKSILQNMDSIKRPLAEMINGTNRTYNMRAA